MASYGKKVPAKKKVGAPKVTEFQRMKAKEDAKKAIN